MSSALAAKAEPRLNRRCSRVDFERIAAREGLGVTYVRRLASLAYLSPRIVEAIAEGRAPADLTATKLLNDMPLRWAEQEQRLVRT